MKSLRPVSRRPQVKDRFISSRVGIDLLENFGKRDQLDDDIDASADLEAPETDSDGLQNRLYKALMQSQVLGLRQGAPVCAQSIFDENAHCSPSPEPGGVLQIASLRSVGPFARSPSDDCFSLSPICGLDESEVVYPFKEQRHISKTPYKVLDAPALQDDYYLDVVHWSKENVLAVGLGRCVYLWAATTSKVTKLHEFEENDSVASVAWSPGGDYLAVGSNRGFVQIWDSGESKLLLNTRVHHGRVGTMSWNQAGSILSTGSRDKSIVHRDIRSDFSASQLVARVLAHKQEVCGLRWSPDDQYISSGGNDNKVLVWSGGKFMNPCLRFTEHRAAVKALAWSPHQNGLLATGGGTADRCLRFWDVTTGKLVTCVDTGSQVCNMVWGTNANELVTTHGYSQNQVALWRCQPLKKIAQLSGHLSRVLYLALSPDGQAVVTGSGDETLRFWQLFPPGASQGLDKQRWNVFPSERNVR